MTISLFDTFLHWKRFAARFSWYWTIYYFAFMTVVSVYSGRLLWKYRRTYCSVSWQNSMEAISYGYLSLNFNHFDHSHQFLFASYKHSMFYLLFVLSKKISFLPSKRYLTLWYQNQLVFISVFFFLSFLSFVILLTCQ